MFTSMGAAAFAERARIELLATRAAETTGRSASKKTLPAATVSALQGGRDRTNRAIGRIYWPTRLAPAALVLTRDATWTRNDMKRQPTGFRPLIGQWR
jgi:hypothetical protein